MFTQYKFGTPIDTEAIINNVTPSFFVDGEYLSLAADHSILGENKDGYLFELSLDPEDIVYGLGENVRGINKRGHKYISFCSDDPSHSEDKNSLYGAHNFLLISSKARNLGLFFDTPSRVVFDIGFTDIDKLYVYVSSDSLTLNVFSGEPTPEETVRQFRAAIGQSYIPPKWAFGYAQSRWGYRSSEDIRRVYSSYKEADLPLDMIYIDIDYMERYKDFTINRESFGDFESLVSEMKDNGVHLVPIIDGGVKIEEGYEVYEEGIANNYFCKDKDNNDFVVGVWPGDCLFPDFLNDKARAWFGQKYKFLLDMGIEGFWNDMNEPAIFYSRKHLNEVYDKLEDYKSKELDLNNFFDFKDLVSGINNNDIDYKSFYNNYKGTTYNHYDVHNLYGYYMSRGAMEEFRKLTPNKDILLISRASYIGMHRYAGIWQGDNNSVWSHLLMNLKMMPSLNMCGFLYTGADLGGFNCNTTEDLLLRWTALNQFIPLMRNHSALGTRQQEFYRFKNIDLFRNLLIARYRMIPYIYDTFVSCVKTNSMMFKPLGFEFMDDPIAREIEDQLLVGNEIMIAPVVTQNTTGRVVYFPERMKEIRFENSAVTEGNTYEQGYHYINLPLGTTNFFLREGRKIPIAEEALSIDAAFMAQTKIYEY